MKKYIVRGIVTATFIIGEFEADSEEEAIEKAEAVYDVPVLCHQCSDAIEINDDADRLEAEKIDGENGG